MANDKSLLPDVNDLIIDKLASYPVDVRELALQSIRLSETYSEIAVADQLQAVVRRLSKPPEGGTL